MGKTIDTFYTSLRVPSDYFAIRRLHKGLSSSRYLQSTIGYVVVVVVVAAVMVESSLNMVWMEIGVATSGSEKVVFTHRKRSIQKGNEFTKVDRRLVVDRLIGQLHETSNSRHGSNNRSNGH